MEGQSGANAGLRVGQSLECVVSGLSHDGRGVAQLEDSVAFVSGALPGDRVRLRLEHRARRHWLARLEAVLQPSAQRCRPACVLADRCGGCSLQHLELQAQRQWKRRQVVEALQRIAQLPYAEQLVASTLCAADGLGYRNRAILPLERRADGSLRAGYYRSGSHTLVNVNHCPVLDPRLDQLIAPLKHDLESTSWPVDRHLQAEGGLRHLALRLGQHSAELLITLVSSHANLPGLDFWAERWLQRWSQLVGVCLNIQDRPTNVLLGPHTEVVAGRGWIEEHFAGVALTIGADTFFQVNTPMAERVVPLLLAGLEGLNSGLLLDAYCGIGTFSLPLAVAGWQVQGIELVHAAVERARLNAERNQLSQRCHFEAGAVGTLLAQRLVGAQALLVDPPRKGLEPPALAAILAAPPERLLYLSCDPATLARDLAALAGAEGPYRLRAAQPLDFFPQTSHVETLATLLRR
jgi:23S rRNA (uracil1939-C5)-methyltransferase